MIRLSASSISLSEHDIQTHLAHLDLYQNLLRQGFESEDARRYVHDYQRRRSTKNTCNHDVLAHEFESTVALRIKSSPDVDVAAASITKPSVLTEHKGDIQQPDTSVSTSSEVAKARVRSLSIHQHAPRQSSLLRFAKAISPDSASSDEPIALTSVQPPRGYRQRSSTYPYEESEADTDDDNGAGIASRFSDLTISSSPNVQEHIDPVLGSRSSLRGSAESFVPFRLPPPFSAAARRVSSQTSLPSSNRNLPAGSHIQPEESVSSHGRDSSSPLHESDLLDMSHRSASLNSPMLPSSPPTNAVHTQQPASDEPDPHMRTQAPTTPVRLRAPQTSRTEPRRQRERYQFLDGPSFAVFNDSSASSSQPQTPADLARRQLITEFDAAYTAPPGMIRNIPLHDATVSSQDEASTRYGEQSPTTRALSIRQRRHREWERSARFWATLRQRDEELARAGTTATATATTGWWRDGLEGDRVGEENFGMLDDTEPASTRSTIRVVSGNAGWTITPRRN